MDKRIFDAQSSFIVTGASATGKTTLTAMAAEVGYRYLPTHTTRALRVNEIDRVHMVSLPEDQFVDEFNSGMYLEPSLDFARLHATGVYYGTPRSWFNKLREDLHCAAPVSVAMARVIFNATGVKWAHLVCDDSVRSERLAARGIGERERFARMSAGDSIASVPPEAEVYDTMLTPTEDILSKITIQKG